MKREKKEKMLAEYNARMEEIKKCCNEEDTEAGHVRADSLLCELLDRLGFQEITKLFKECKRWYA